MENNTFFDRELGLFFLLLTMITGLFWGGLYWTDNYWIFMSSGYMWSPAIAIVLTKLILKKELNLHLSWPSWKNNFKAILFPLFYCVLIYGAAYVFGLTELNSDYINRYAGQFKMESQLTFFLVVFIVLKGILGTLGNLSSSFGEELGWRGFLYPKLRNKYGFVSSSLIVGLIWSIWHYPLILKNTWSNPEVDTGKITLFFTGVLVLLSFLYSYLFEQSKSVWPAVVLHSAHNSIMGGTFDNIFVEEGYFVGETGVITMLVLTGIAVYCILRIKLIPLENENSNFNE